MAGGNKPGHPDVIESYVHRIGMTVGTYESTMHFLIP
jgi:hypothetical protein